MADKQQIIEFIKSNGPSLPTQVANHFKESSFIIGALLSELVKSGQIHFSKLKVGASPLYYLYEQRHKLQDYADYLNEKDKEAYDLLKQKGVLYDRDLTPLLRVSMRTITDFAVPVRVSVNNSEELFWRWYLTPLDSIEDKIRARFSQQEEKETAQEPEQNAKEDTEKQQQAREEEPPKTFNTTSTNKEEQGESNQEETTKEHKEEKQGPAEEQQQLRARQQTVQETQDKQHSEDELDDRAREFFQKKDIRIKSFRQVRKNQELEYEIIVPTPIGDVDYFCRAKAKKKLNENDLANAYLAGKRKELPVLLITTGELTKKAENSVDKDFPGVKVKEI